MKKIIAILGLFIIGIGSTYAVDQNFYPNTPATLLDGQNNDLELKPGINFLFNDTYKVISVYGGGPYPRLKNVFWTNEGLYFIRSCAGGYDCVNINTSIEMQGFVDGFLECAISDTPCTNGYKIINEFTTNNEYASPDYLHLIDNQWNNTTLSLCFVYESLNKQACFNLDQVSLSNSLGFTYNPLPSQYGNSTSQIVEYFTNSPFIQTTPTKPTQQYTCPTIQQLIDTYPQQYNTGLCYSSNIIYSGGTIQTITPKTIFELYPTRKNLNQDIQNYNTYCNNVATQQACQTIFEGKNEEYTLIAKIPQDVMPMQLYTYCNLTLNMDPNSTTCTASTGTINNGIGIDDIIDNIGKTPITVITPGTPPEDEGNGTGSVFDKYTQEEDETKRRNIIQKAEDTIETMKEIYAKLTGIFRARQGKNGIVPPLITGLIALIILYKLFKK